MRCLLRPSTVHTMWQSQVSTKETYGGFNSEGYGLGWTIATPRRVEPVGSEEREVPLVTIGHGGGAVGATSILTLLPAPSNSSDDDTVCAIMFFLKSVL